MNANTLPDDIRLSELYPDHLNIIKKRHDLTLERGSAEHVVIFSGTELPVFLDDTYYPFRPNPHFLAWVPIPSPN